MTDKMAILNFLSEYGLAPYFKGNIA